MRNDIIVIGAANRIIQKFTQNGRNLVMADNQNYQDKYDIFLSYRRDGGETMAILLRERLIAKGYRVFLDIESMNSGSFNEKLISIIEGCTDVVVVCSKGSLDRCSNEGDWVRMEIAHAFKNGKNGVPVILRNFKWPDVLPDDIDALRVQNGVIASSNEYFDAAINRLTERFLKSTAKGCGEKNSTGMTKGILMKAAVVALVAALVIGGIALLRNADSRIFQSDGEGGNITSPGTTATGVATTINVGKTTSPPSEAHPIFITIKGKHYSTSLYELDLSNIGLLNDDIIPLQFMTNLQVLNLGGNQINDLTPLANITSLTALYLYDNKRISDLSPLSNLTNMTKMSIYWNEIRDITPLSGLTNLEWLELAGNQISDLTPLKNLRKLTYLSLHDNPVSDWSPVEHILEVRGLITSVSE